MVMCVCHRRTFRELMDLVLDRGGMSCEELVREGYCGGGCGMCVPYVKKMLATGETAFAPGDWVIRERTDG